MKEFVTSNLIGEADLEEQRKIRKEIKERWLRAFGTAEKVESGESITDLYDSMARSPI